MSHELHQMLLQVKREGAAICSQCMVMEEHTWQLEEELDDLLARWPDRRGEAKCVPVEGRMSLFHEAAVKETLWENPRRHALLDWLLEETKP